MPRACLGCRRCVECRGPGRPSLPPSGEVTEGQEGVCPLTSEGLVLLLWAERPSPDHHPGYPLLTHPAVQPSLSRLPFHASLCKAWLMLRLLCG